MNPHNQNPPIRVMTAHSYDYPTAFLRIGQFLEREGFQVVDNSIPAWEPVSGPDSAVLEEIASRVMDSDVLLVHVTEDIHKSPFITYEVDVARATGTRIIAVYPNGELGGPIPRNVVEGAERTVGWRGGSLTKAIRGEEGPNCRVFDIAEDADLRSLLYLAGTAVAGAAFLFVGVTEARLTQLRDRLAAVNIPVDRPRQSLAMPLVGAGVGGLVVFLIYAFLGGSRAKLPFLITAGAVAGATVGYAIDRWIELRQLGALWEMRIHEGAPAPLLTA